MAIGPIEIHGAISRVQDFAVQRQNEDGKGVLDQVNAQQVVRRDEENKANTVNRSEQTSEDRKKFDAKEKGSNEYAGDGGKKNKSQEEKREEGKVIVKGQPMSFDVRI